MKNSVCLLISVLLCLHLSAQIQELEQLKLNLEKLAQFKLMLSEMKSGYQTLSNGYNAVRDAGKSNFNLHQKHLDELLAVSPAVKNNPAVQRIFTNQVQIINTYKNLITKLRTSGVFLVSELTELAIEANRIIDIVSADAEMVQTVLTPGKMRMSDAERAGMIEKTDASVLKQLSQLKGIADEYGKTMMIRLQQKRDIEMIKKLGKKN